MKTSPSSSPRRSRLTAGALIALAGASAAGWMSSTPAVADSPLPTSLAGQELSPAVGPALSGVLAPAKDLQLDPFANTAVDPLDNAVGTQVADFQPVSSEAVTGPLARGASLDDLPLLGAATQVLPG
ncbi:hypothetical protein ACIBI4_19760 [Streptomyces sp. NPDC050418]|uniref:hypothetical protein n=1 Tax=Streptomyces sp. NPDC050418 TaxID=3365612 RepID=UPI0037A0EA8A